MSARVRAIRDQIRAVVRAPKSRRELVLLTATLAYYQVQAQAALMAPAPQPQREWVSARQAAAITGLSRSWLYEHARELAFARKKGARVLFDEHALREWMRRR
jgi:predicted DNA-binding transcriptional regulator AlpA